jgi:hypothetical protein
MLCKRMCTSSLFIIILERKTIDNITKHPLFDDTFEYDSDRCIFLLNKFFVRSNSINRSRMGISILRDGIVLLTIEFGELIDHGDIMYV